MSIRDLEIAAESIYERAKIKDRNAIVSPVGLAQRILGRDAVRRVPHLQSVASIARIGAKHVIAVRDGLPKPYEAHAVGHELAHYVEAVDGVSFTESQCDYIGAALMLRKQPFICRCFAATWEQLAFDFGTTQTSVALRLGEVLDVPIAVVTPEKVHARGRIEGPSTKKIPITDAPGRFALTVVR